MKDRDIMKLMGTVIVIILLVLSTAGCVSDDELKELEDENKKLKKQNDLLEDENEKLSSGMYWLYQNFTNLTAEFQLLADDLEKAWRENELLNFTISVFISDINGLLQDINNLTVDLEELENNILNITSSKAFILPSTMRGPAPLEVDFHTFSTDLASDGASWLWNFSDGNHSNEVSPTHTFEKPGGYLVFLEIQNKYNISCFASVIITVEEIQPEIIVFSGTGDSITDSFYLSKSIISFKISHDGEHYFGIWLFNLDTSEREDLIVNEVGYYNGKTLIEVDDGGYSDGEPGYHMLDINADGNWEVTIEHL